MRAHLVTLTSARALRVTARRDARARSRGTARRRRCLADDDKMFVPAGAFAGRTPERRASEMMNAMLTYVSAWIVIGQLENVAPRRSVAGTDAGAEDAADEATREANRVVDSHQFLLEYLEANPVRDGDGWITALTKIRPELARRIMEVRLAYARDDQFEWHNVRKLCVESIALGNETAMREWLRAAVPTEA